MDIILDSTAHTAARCLPPEHGAARQHAAPTVAIRVHRTVRRYRVPRSVQEPIARPASPIKVSRFKEPCEAIRRPQTRPGKRASVPPTSIAAHRLTPRTMRAERWAAVAGWAVTPRLHSEARLQARHPAFAFRADITVDRFAALSLRGLRSPTAARLRNFSSFSSLAIFSLCSDCDDKVSRL